MAKEQRIVHEALVFRLSSKEVNINLLKVKKFDGYDAVTRIANALEFVEGCIDLRSIIVPSGG